MTIGLLTDMKKKIKALKKRIADWIDDMIRKRITIDIID